MGAWAYSLTVRDQFIVFCNGRPVAEVWWVNELEPGQEYAMDRIVHGLNTAPTADRSTWSWAEPGTPGRFDLCHNGRAYGQFVFTQTPKRPAAAWVDRVVAGLNETVPGLPIPYPKQINVPTVRPDAHLSIVRNVA